VVVDEVLFRLQAGELVIMRPCVEYGFGRFASPAITSSADLGYALDEWQPHCDTSVADDPDEDRTFSW
jgi:hypothetical protein